jgi:hypothetical protein
VLTGTIAVYSDFLQHQLCRCCRASTGQAPSKRRASAGQAQGKRQASVGQANLAAILQRFAKLGKYWGSAGQAMGKRRASTGQAHLAPILPYLPI